MRLRHDWYAWDVDYFTKGLERCRRHPDEIRDPDPKNRIEIHSGIDTSGQPFVEFTRVTYGNWADRIFKRRIARAI